MLRHCIAIGGCGVGIGVAINEESLHVATILRDDFTVNDAIIAPLHSLFREFPYQVCRSRGNDSANSYLTCYQTPKLCQ